MRIELFTVFDSAAGAFLPPFAAPTIEVAIRMFRQAVNQADGQFHRFPEDYTLFHVGSFDQEDGLLEGLATPHSLGVAITFMERTDRYRELMNASGPADPELTIPRKVSDA